MFSDAKSIAFSSDRKRMSTFYHLQDGKQTVRICVKGQASILIERCTSIISANGEIKEFTKDQKDKIRANVIVAFAK